MWRANLKSTWSQLMAWGAVGLGFGALLGGGARADIAATPEQLPGAAARGNEVIVKIVGENILLSQDGSAFEALRLRDTPEAAYFKNLLREAGPAGQSISVPIGSTMVASGGGSAKGERPKESGGK